MKNWLKIALEGAASRVRPRSQLSKLLVLTGPSGAGKTAVVETLAKELQYELLVWSNPVNTNAIGLSDSDTSFNKGDPGATSGNPAPRLKFVLYCSGLP